jgi:hypothetical protein
VGSGAAESVYRMDYRRIRVRSRYKQGIVRANSETPCSTDRYRVALFPVVKRPGREANYTNLVSLWNYASILPYMHMAR